MCKLVWILQGLSIPGLNVRWHVCRVENILQWQLEAVKENMGGGQAKEPAGEAGLGGRRASVLATMPSLPLANDLSGSRPLYAKLELLLDLIFRRLYHNNTQSMQDYSLDAVLRLLKKKDKDMGP